MHHCGEADVRSTYCALSVASILNLLVPEVTHKASQYIARFFFFFIFFLYYFLYIIFFILFSLYYFFILFFFISYLLLPTAAKHMKEDSEESLSMKLMVDILFVG